MRERGCSGNDSRPVRLQARLDACGADYERLDSVRGTLFIVTAEDGSRFFAESWDEGGFCIWGGTIAADHVMAAFDAWIRGRSE